MRRKILIVDDNAINRALLKNTLYDAYDILEAEDGKEALAIMHRDSTTLSAVLLDIRMPEMDGYDVLHNARDNILLSQLPIIMVTSSEDEESRVKALSLGANDFITKPFNPEIVKHCLRNNIMLRETATILNAIQRDKLTGLYNREAFFEKVSEMLHSKEPGYYILSCFDIDNFKLINDQFGAAEGDRILRKIGTAAKEELAAIGGIAGRISADNFAALYPTQKQNINIVQRMKARNLVLLEQQAVVFSVGRYVVSDITLSASAIYDRAYIAKQSVKGRYDQHLAYFDETMLERLVLNQQITSEMEAAIAERQFEVWFQPQYNHATGMLIGAEALARWRHPQKGIVPPGDFIPLFEQIGFVYELDKYIWREVCRYLHKWIGEGRDPLPVSVNVSRYDIFRTDLIDVITGLVQEFNIPVDLLRLEITESAFSTSTERIVKIVKQLIALGFTIEIDDFGSGYSSLNTLKDVPAQVIKLDMRFLESDDDSQRGGNILESIVRMTKWLGMTVLAEGVEEKNQADFLQSIGCTYIQGYLYARPMPAHAYEALCDGSSAQEQPFVMDLAHSLEGSFWNPKSLDTLVFNNYAGGACVYEYHADHIELIRVTDKYVHTVFGRGMSTESLMRIDWSKHTTSQTLAVLKSAMLRSIQIKTEVVGEYSFFDLPGCPHEIHLRSSLRVIASAGDRHLIYCISENITPQRQAEQKELEATQKCAVVAERVQAILDSVTCGVSAIALNETSIRLVFANDKFFEILGCPRKSCGEDFAKIPVHVYPDDLPLVLLKMEEAKHSSASVTFEYRAILTDSKQIWLRHRVANIRFSDIDAPILLNVLHDITTEKTALQKVMQAETQQALLINSIPGGIATHAVFGSTPPYQISLTYFSDGFCQLFGYTREEYEKRAAVNPTGLVFKEDLCKLMEQIGNLVREGTPIDCIYRTHTKDKGYKWIRLQSTVQERYREKVTAFSVFLDVTTQQEALERLRMSEEEYRLAIRYSKNAVCRYDVASRTLTISPDANPIFQMNPSIEDVPYGPVRKSEISPETAAAYTAFYKSILQGEKTGEVVYQRKSTLGWRWIEAHFSTIFSGNGEPASAVISFADVTDTLEKEVAYRKWQQSLSGKKPDSYSLFRCNVSNRTISSATEGSLLPMRFKLGSLRMDEQTTMYVEQRVLAEDGKRFAAFMNPDTMLRQYNQHKRTDTLEYREKLDGCGFRWMRLTVDLLESPHSRDIEAFLLFEDIDETKRSELAIVERAENDPLTNVLNRTTFAERVNQRIRESQPGEQHALLMLDIDGFKLVNDVFGHSVGDQTLIDIAELLLSVFRHNDLVGRLGGDEFVIFLTDIPDDETAANKAKQICALTRKAFSVEVQISGSVGIVICPRDGKDFETLYRKADDTLYYVKGSGKNNYAFYHEEIEIPQQNSKTLIPERIAKRIHRRKRCMLIVDDSAIDCSLLSCMFENEFRIEKAMSGNAALVRLRHYGSAISIVLLDLMMPGMDGFAVLERMQQSSVMKSIPVVVVSGDNNRATGLKAIQAGATDFVTKPVDAEVLRIRVQSAISKAENERLRAHNSFLAMQSSEMTSYRTVLDHIGLVVIELDWGKGLFIYSPSVSEHLAGKYDSRILWHILLSDLVADANTVKRMQNYVHDIAEDRNRTEGSLTAQLKAPCGKKHWFHMNIYKLTNEYGLTDKLILTFQDIDAEYHA